MEIWINFNASVNPVTAGKLVTAITNAINSGATKIHLLINTGGGTVLHGRGIFTFLQSISIPVDTYNLGQVDSIGGVMYLAGTGRYTVEYGSFLIHPVQMNVQGNASFPEKMLRERTEALKQDRESIAQIYAERTKIDLNTFESLMFDGTTLAPREAIERGVAHVIKAPKIPTGTQLLSIVD